jgi:NCS1 family nucleobase:cation symporter-1
VAFPAPKQTGASPFVMELHRTRPIDGQYVESNSTQEEEAIAVGKEKFTGLGSGIFRRVG